jgi:hypothetical protein
MLIEQVRQRADGGLIIAVLGMLTPAEAELLARLRSSGATCVAFLMDTSTWVSLPAQSRTEADRAHDTAVHGILNSGWRVVSVAHGSSLPALWPQVARGSQGFAWRAALAEAVTGGVR